MSLKKAQLIPTVDLDRYRYSGYIVVAYRVLIPKGVDKSIDIAARKPLLATLRDYVRSLLKARGHDVLAIGN